MPKKKEVDFKSVPMEPGTILRQCTEEQLSYLSRLASDKNFNDFVEIIKIFGDYYIQRTFAYPEDNPQKLASFKAYARGQVGSLTTLMYVVKGADQEIKKRAQQRKEKASGR